MTTKTPEIIQYFKNYHYLLKKLPHYINIKPKLIEQIKIQRSNKILKLKLIHDNHK